MQLTFYFFLHSLSKTQLQERLGRGREITVSWGFTLAHMGCYDETPQSGWLTDNRNVFFLTVLEAGCPVEAPAQPLSGEGPLPNSLLDFPRYSQMVEGARASLEPLLYGGNQGSSLMT